MERNPLSHTAANFFDYFDVFLCLFFSGHQNLLSGHQKMKIEDFGGPNGPPTKKVRVEPWNTALGIREESHSTEERKALVYFPGQRVPKIAFDDIK